MACGGPTSKADREASKSACVARCLTKASNARLTGSLRSETKGFWEIIGWDVGIPLQGRDTLGSTWSTSMASRVATKSVKRLFARYCC